MSNSRLMRRYLLGTATPAERIALENDYLANAEAFQELTAAENDLIDSYARSELSSLEKQAFEKRYLNSVHGQSRIEFARSLGVITKEVTPSTLPRASLVEKFLSVFRIPVLSPAWRFAGACAIVLIVGLVSLQLLRHRGFKNFYEWIKRQRIFTIVATADQCRESPL